MAHSSASSNLDLGNRLHTKLVNLQDILHGLEEEATSVSNFDNFNDSHLLRLQETLADMPLEYLKFSGSDDNVNDDFDMEIQSVKNELAIVEREMVKSVNEIENLAAAIAKDTNNLTGDIELLTTYIEFWQNDDNVGGGTDKNAQIKELENKIEQQKSEESKYDDISRFEICLLSGENFMFEALELEDQLIRKRQKYGELRMLDDMSKRVDALSMIEESLSDIKDIGFLENCIKLTLKTFIPAKGGPICQFEINNIGESFMVEHVLKVKVEKDSTTFLDAELSPDDIPIDDIIHMSKYSSDVSDKNISLNVNGQLNSLVREIQYRIFCYTLRNSVLEHDGKASRNSFQYSPRDQVITVNVFGGIKAYIKLPQNWPVSPSPLMLLSLKQVDESAGDISLNMLCRAMEILNELELSRRQRLLPFIDAVEEILLQQVKKSSKS